MRFIGCKIASLKSFQAAASLKSLLAIPRASLALSQPISLIEFSRSAMHQGSALFSLVSSNLCSHNLLTLISASRRCGLISLLLSLSLNAYIALSSMALSVVNRLSCLSSITEGGGIVLGHSFFFTFQNLFESSLVWSLVFASSSITLLYRCSS